MRSYVLVCGRVKGLVLVKGVGREVVRYARLLLSFR
jgi:hypothetical protein